MPGIIIIYFYFIFITQVSKYNELVIEEFSNYIYANETEIINTLVVLIECTIPNKYI